MLNLAHLGLALVSLLAWIGYLATGVTGLAWAGCALLLPVAGLGMALVFRTPDRAPTGLAAVAAGASRPAPVAAGAGMGADVDTGTGAGRGAGALTVAAHITAASLTILLAVLAAIGSG